MVESAFLAPSSGSTISTHFGINTSKFLSFFSINQTSTVFDRLGRMSPYALTCARAFHQTKSLSSCEGSALSSHARPLHEFLEFDRFPALPCLLDFCLQGVRRKRATEDAIYTALDEIFDDGLFDLRGD